MAVKDLLLSYNFHYLNLHIGNMVWELELKNQKKLEISKKLLIIY